MCMVGSALVDLFHSAVAELSAAQSCDRGLDMLSASLVIRIDRAAQDAIAAHAAVEEHGSRCSHCGGLRRLLMISISAYSEAKVPRVG
jgi:hypothetical protein